MAPTCITNGRRQCTKEAGTTTSEMNDAVINDLATFQDRNWMILEKGASPQQVVHVN